MIEGMTEKIPEDRWKLEKVLETLNAKAKSAQTEEIQ